MAHCDAMAFETDFDTIRHTLNATHQMLGIITSDEAFPIENIHDTTDRLRAIRAEGTFIASNDLLKLRASLGAMSDIASFFSRHRNDEGTTPYPDLDQEAEAMTTFPMLINAIDRIIDRWGNVKDNASPELAEIRANLERMNGSIGATMRRVIARAIKEGYLDADTTAAVRDGRPVIPVAPMHKRKISGIVHDESASGKTFYIEPAEVVEANNRLRELQIEERREVTRILTALAAIIRPEINNLIESFNILGLFDFIYAKARYAQTVNATMPNLTNVPEMEWYHACHPVLQLSLERQGKQIVPLDITLNDMGRILIISGPNAGGKSVTLKTVAIVQYMAQCGVLPTLYDNSHMGIFDTIFIDIGDDQSIEDDLSTYSSHLRNMKLLVNKGNERTLALIDEFGGGTEPQIGGAIAQALLKQFNDHHLWGIITTHFQNLKQLAEETPGLVNGSMLYDRQLMQPMFQLSIGHPGSSFALEIARKIGLPESIISDAEEIVGSDYVNLDRYLLDITRDRRYWENKRQSIRQKEKRLDQILSQYEADADNLRQKRREIIAEARDEARKILEGSNATIERTIRDIREAQAERERTLEARRRLDEDKRNLAREADNVGEHPLIAKSPKRKKRDKTPAPQVKERPLAVGDNVQLDGEGVVGAITEINGKNATVIFGQLKTTVKLSRLKHTLKQVQSGARRSVSYLSSATTNDIRERQLNFKTEIDVRGMRVDEAVQAVTYFIDDAIQFNSGRVRILHGTGTGALRQYIRNYLETIPSVRSYHDEDVRFGGAGITVVEL
jgi:DNA mismatch repair protein MutS2